jgi:8-oxo-dGTP diphosphatase
MLTVVAALIESAGKLLVCQRRRADTFALMWEFPGGKAHPGETHQKALQRELLEELGVESSIGPELFRTRHQYPHMEEPIEPIFFAAYLEAGAIQNLAFESMEWRLPSELSGLNFLPADRELIERLANGAIQIPHSTLPPHRPESLGR